MACKITSFRRRRGFTLAELMVTMGISSIVMAAIAALSLYTGRSFAHLSNYVDLDNLSRNALDIMTRDIRQVNFLDSFTSNRLVFQDSDLQELVFEYDPNAKTLVRIKGGERKVLLTECDLLIFRTWQRNMVPGSFDLIPTTNAATCKAIDVTWVCSRKVLGARVNTESVQTARVIIRKQ